MTLESETNLSSNLPLCGRDASLQELFALCWAIRAFECSLLGMFEKGLLTGTTHTCYGQEATAVGVVSAIDKQKDIVFSNHRGHGHFLAYCGEAERLYCEIMGKPYGVCAGRGGSQHLHFRNFYSNGVQGGIVPVTAGMALAEKNKGSGAVAVVFLGDGTLGEGVVYESFNLASLWSLPVLFVIDDNGYAQSTPSRLQVAGSIAERPKAFGIPTEELAVNDAREVLAAAVENIDGIRRTSRPRCLVLRSVRLGPHSKGDDTRSAEELEALQERDPLRRMESLLPTETAEKIKKESGAAVERARQQAVSRPGY